MTLSQIANEFSHNEVDLLKIDIEGAEHQIANEDPTMFRKFKHIIAEVHGDRPTCTNFEKVLEGQGFSIHRASDNCENFSCEVIIASRKAA